MSEEEKRAIELLKQEPDFSLSYYKREHAIDIVLNLIDKQQKEIEEKTTILLAGAEKVKQLEKEIEELKHNRDEYKEEYIKLLNARYYNYISKDKIREKIEEIESYAFTSKEEKNQQDYAIERIKELLEENDE